MRRLLMTTALALVTTLPAFAEDAALLMGVERYQALDRYVGGTTITNAARELADAGYAVATLENETAEEMRKKLVALQIQSADAERLVVALSGRFATDGRRTWFMAVDADEPNLFDVALGGISVESVMNVMAATPGKSVLLLSYDDRASDEFDDFLRAGIGDLDIPQGVSVVFGDPRNVTGLLEGAIVTPDADIVSDVARNRNLKLQGYHPQVLVLQEGQIVVAPVGGRPYVVDREAERVSWELAVTLDTVDAYRAYLTEYPRGTNAADALAAINGIMSEPNREARVAEDALNLTRDQRRSVQRDLSILTYDTRGIDGIYGQGTRSAISNWQQQNGFSQTSYLTQEQITRINAQASRKSAELEAEAARERAAQLQLDRAYWEETGANGREAGLRSYLERYPDGLYAEEATAQLSRYEEQKLLQAAQADRDAWNIARNQNTVGGYESYLKNQSRGAFREEAQTRITAMRQEESASADTAQARKDEADLGLNAVTRRMVEGRLSSLGFDPGSVDGRFNAETRRAIRQFQRSRNLTPSGFLTQSALVQLLIPARN